MTPPKQPIKDAHHPITMLDETLDHQGFRKVVTYQYREKDSGLEARREIVKTQSAIAVIAYDPDQQKLMMIRQFRLGAQLATDKGMTIEVVAGLIDADEEPANAAKRELLEESGLDALSLEHCCSFLTTPGLTDEMIHLYFARVDASNLAVEAGEASETERTFPFLLSVEEAMAAVDENTITNGIAMLALMWFQRHHVKLLESAIT